ncbi:Nascent polypeptide-associated complex subunit beta [Penicillium mononematosum]|nr:Nascent polypeptide-associated complex subunit beta [Penicillium mononematosum]KAJ6179827.1 Nascent polypeptide-associated complex subunit beta [Penicillium mononematosum]
MDLRDIIATRGFATYSLRHPREALSSFGPTLNEATFGYLGPSFKPERDIRNLDGKVILVTGGNAGIGQETILQLAKHRPSRIYMAAQPALLPADIRFLALDLSSFKSIRAAADKFKSDSDRLDILILNAGTMGNPPTTTEEGFEKTVDLQRAKDEVPDVRVVTLASAAHAVGPSTFEEITSTPGLLASSTWTRYGASKSANILFASELARRHPDILSIAVHPGAVDSGLYGHTKSLNSVMKHGLAAAGSTFFRSVATGALNSLWAAGTQSENIINGAYYTPIGYRSGGTATVQDAQMGHIVVTGGSGKAGQFVISELLSAGHIILNLDLMPLEHPKVHTLKTDLADSGQVFNALSGQWALREPFPEGLPPRPDAVIHLAGYARNMLVPDNETFRSNTQGTYNIIEAACKLGIRKIIIASSVTVYGVAFAQGDKNFPSFPIHEDLDVNPTDTYAIAKLCGERIARGFAARFGVDIYILRIGRVIEPEEYNKEIFYSYVHEPAMWKVHGWSYIDSRDLGGMCEAALRTDGLGFQIFNATNDHITNLSPTKDFLKSQFPDIPITREMEEFEAPFSNAKIKKLLGFQEKHPWHKYFSNWEKKQIEIEKKERAKGLAERQYPTIEQACDFAKSQNHQKEQIDDIPIESIYKTYQNLIPHQAITPPDFIMDQAKLARMQASVRIGYSRRKVKKVVRNSGADDKKLQAALKKLNVQPIQGIEEVNMFKEDGNVIHFANPRVHGAVPSNTFALYGNGEEKELTELVPNILNQLGPDSLASLRKLAESYQNMQKQQGDKKDDEEDDIPDLVEGENFETKE